MENKVEQDPGLARLNSQARAAKESSHIAKTILVNYVFVELSQGSMHIQREHRLISKDGFPMRKSPVAIGESTKKRADW